MTTFTGTSGDDHLVGTTSPDIFNMDQGGNDFADGSDANDTFNLGASLNALDEIHGGAGLDTINLSGNYNLVFGTTTIADIEVLVLTGGPYTLTMADQNVTLGHSLQVNGSAIPAGLTFTFNGSAETDGGLLVTGGAGDDAITTGARNDTVTLTAGGVDIANGNAGSDTFNMGATFTRDDRIDGGTGGLNENDKLVLDGDYSGGLKLAAATMHEIENILFAPSHSYKLSLKDGNVESGHILTVDGPLLGPGNFMKINGGAETDGSFVFNGAQGADVFTGGTGADIFSGGNNADTLEGGAGADQFNYSFAVESTGTTFDSIVGYDALADHLHLTGGVPDAVDAAVLVGRLSKGDFDAELAAAIGPGELGGHHALLFQPDHGNLAGHVFVVIDRNNTDGYQSGADLVMELVNGTHLGQFDLADFV